MRNILLLAAAGVLLIIFGLTFSGCATVKPYEREALADQIMTFDASSEEQMMERHFLETREGSSGGTGGAGGGCACN